LGIEELRGGVTRAYKARGVPVQRQEKDRNVVRAERKEDGIVEDKAKGAECVSEKDGKEKKGRVVRMRRVL
jgi:hypothetical protein